RHWRGCRGRLPARAAGRAPGGPKTWPREPDSSTVLDITYRPHERGAPTAPRHNPLSLLALRAHAQQRAAAGPAGSGILPPSAVLRHLREGGEGRTSPHTAAPAAPHTYAHRASAQVR